MDAGIKRYILEAFRVRYHRASRKGRSEILDEVCREFKCHRKHGVRLMRKRLPGAERVPGKRGRRSKYNDPGFLSALHKVRRVMEFRNAEVIKENMPEWLPAIERHYGEFSETVRTNLLSISVATMKRYFQRMREQGGGGLSTTRPSTILRTEVPIRTESFWDESVPGKMAADTVAHCGSSTEGQYINSLDMVCPVTHWCAQRATWGKGSTGILEETKNIEKSLPFKLIGLHVDNGSEFMNYAYVRYFTDEALRARFSMTRSRANRKNDNCHVEQKNWSVIRRYFGYDRLEFPELVPLMNDLYKSELNLYLNHFCRTFKLEAKIAIKSRYKRVYGKPQTPYQRVLQSLHVEQYVKNRLIDEHQRLDPVLLRMQIERKLKNIFALYKKITKARLATNLA